VSDCPVTGDVRDDARDDARDEAQGRRPRWDHRCTEIVTHHAAGLGNTELAALIEAETGLRFQPKTVSEHRAALGIRAPQPNAWTAALRRWRPWG
jgi:hypothetical protein